MWTINRTNYLKGAKRLNSQASLLSELAANINADSEEKISKCYQFIEVCVENNNLSGEAFGLYQIGEIKYQEKKYKQSLEFHSKAYQLLGEKTDHGLFSKLSISSGRIYIKLGTEQRALDFLIKGLKVTKQEKDLATQARYYKYIALVYRKLGACEEALEFYHREKRCYQKLLKCKENQNLFTVRLLRLQLNEGITYCMMHQYDQALELLIQVERQEVILYDELIFLYCAFKIETFYGLTRYNESIPYITLFIERAKQLTKTYDIFDNCYGLFQKMLSLNRRDEALRFLGLLKLSVGSEVLEHYQLRYLDALIQYTLQYGSKQEFIQYFEQYLKVANKFQEDLILMKTIQIHDRKQLDSTSELKRIVLHNMNLMKEKSEHDALTKLANRYSLIEYSERKVKVALKNQVTLGIDVIDVDYFKQYNDYYGHLGGDHCLLEVAEAMKKVAGDHFLARFGGDEFFIVTIGITKEELHQIAEELQHLLWQKQIQQAQGQPYQYVTVSQGIVCQIPTEGQTISDFIHCADLALYKGKKCNKNSIYIGQLA